MESSRNAYLIGVISSLILLKYGNNIDKNIGLFFFIVAQMQIIEYFIWKDKSCGKINNIASKLIVPELSMQVIGMILGAYLFNTTNISKENMFIILILTIILTIGSLLYYFYYINNETLCSKKILNKGIEWDIGTFNIIDDKDIFSIIWKIIYYSVLFFFPLLWKSTYKKYIYVITAITSYVWIRINNKITWKSRWCYPASFASIYFVLLMLIN